MSEEAPKKCPECVCPDGLPEWLATFGDLMSLLLTFFILLLSFANMDLQKFKDMMGSIRDAFGVQTDRPMDTYVAYSPSRYEREEVKLDSESRKIMQLSLQISAMFQEDQELAKQAQVTPDDKGVLVRVGSGALFAPGSAKLKPEASRVLEEVITILVNFNFDVVVRGHTDDSEPLGGFGSYWELSAARAAAALNYIITRGHIAPSRLKAVGYADTRPLMPNTSEANRATNRRVEFYFHRAAEKGAW
jgi:chemotaxis protein MotB